MLCILEECISAHKKYLDTYATLKNVIAIYTKYQTKLANK